MNNIDSALNNPEATKAICNAMDLANLGVIAPHKSKYYNRYNIQWLIDEINSGEKHSFFTFCSFDKSATTIPFGRQTKVVRIESSLSGTPIHLL